MVKQPQSVTATAILIWVVGFMVGALLVLVLLIPRDGEVETGSGANVPGAPGQLQQPAQGSLQGAGNPQPPAGSGLQGGAPVSEQQARQLLQ